MELRHLRYFLAVAKYLSYTRAATSLHMAVSPLSRAIRELEIELGGSLFDRGTRHVSLSPMGTRLVPRAQDILVRVESLGFLARSQTASTLTVGIRAVPPPMKEILVTEVFSEAFPRATVIFSPEISSRQIGDLLNGSLAFAVVAGRPQDPRIDLIPILTETIGAALPDRPEYRRLRSVRPEHMAGLRIIPNPDPSSIELYYAAFIEASRGIRTVSNEIAGGIAEQIAGGGHTTFVQMNPEAPWHRAFVGAGVIVRPLAGRYSIAVTYLCWLKSRANGDDLGPAIDLARRRFAEPEHFGDAGRLESE